MKGLTLIETVLYCAIFSILITSSFGIAEIIFQISSESAADARAEKIGSFILNRFEYQINTNSPLVLPSYAKTPISSLTIERLATSSDKEEINVSFSIDDHQFNLHRIIP